MRKARNRFERVHQVLRWIESEWPIARPVDLVWVDEILDDDGTIVDAVGQTYRYGNRIVIEMRRRGNGTWAAAIDTIIHEATHAIQWGLAKTELRCSHHGPAFYAQEGEIKDRFYHDHGDEQSREFPVE